LEDSQSFELKVAEYIKGESINAFELGYFLYFFRSAYVASLEILVGQDVTLEQIVKTDLATVKAALNKDVGRLWAKNLPYDQDLEFSQISKNSPIKFCGYATGTCLLALTLAVILSGGKANIKTGEFELPPLATGIRELKKTFDQPAPKLLPSEAKAKAFNSGEVEKTDLKLKPDSPRDSENESNSEG
jgi:hypothetical protein